MSRKLGQCEVYDSILYLGLFSITIKGLKTDVNMVKDVIASAISKKVA